MNNYLDLLDINPNIDVEIVLESRNRCAKVVINGDTIYDGIVSGTVNLTHTVPLLMPVILEVHHQGVYLSSLKFDDWEARPQHAWEIDGVFTLNTKVPFYQWQHHATAQGWLLSPH